MDGVPRRLISSKWAPGLQPLVDECLQPDPRKRPTAARLLQHDFLTQACSLRSFCEKLGKLQSDGEVVGREKMEDQRDTRKDSRRVRKHVDTRKEPANERYTHHHSTGPSGTVTVTTSTAVRTWADCLTHDSSKCEFTWVALEHSESEIHGRTY